MVRVGDLTKNEKARGDGKSFNIKVNHKLMMFEGGISTIVLGIMKQLN